MRPTILGVFSTYHTDLQLSRLEVKGFKSFGDKIVIHFDNGITGIVGPNGCGKSNVVDAIRWVLGEQKIRNLRSEKMEDVIFNGTKDRKAHQMAEVAITFNNTKNLLPTAYSQVTVTRRYYRSGDSDYELNGVPCRLKDIHDLFMDTGIGSDSYSIIELNMVKDLLEDRDGSRREMFEEAAGISKFKIRKKQTLRKLDDTEKDLNRVEDLLFEIEKNLKSLEKQAKQAEKYYELREEYKANSITLAHVVMANGKAVVAALQERILEEKSSKTKLMALWNALEAAIEKTKATIVSKERELRTAQTILNDHMVKLRTYESERKIKHERLKYLTETQEKLLRQLQADKEQRNKSELILKNIQKEEEHIASQLTHQETHVAELQAQVTAKQRELQHLQHIIAELDSKQKSNQELSYQLSKSLEISQFQISSIKQELEKASTDDHSQSDELAGFETKISQLSLQIGDKELALIEMENEESELAKNQEVLETSMQKLKDLVAESSRKLDAKTNEFNLTKSLVDNLEGFPEAVRFLKKNASWISEVPLLSDILTCAEKYRLPIENFLEPFMNYYIVPTQEEALRAVKLLSESGKGKANFFILSTFDHFSPSISPQIDGAIPAFSVLDYEVRYEKLLQYLLSEVYIVDERNLPESPTNGFVFISENGKFIKRKHALSGGSVGLFEGKRIGRAKNLEVLEKEIKSLADHISLSKSQLAEYAHQLSALKQNTRKSEIEGLRKEFNLLKQEYVAYSSKRDQLHSVLSKNTGRKEELLERLELLTQEIDTKGPKAKEVADALETLTAVLEENRVSYNELNTEFAAISALYNEANIQWIQRKGKADGLRQDMEYRASALKLLDDRILAASEELKKVEADTQLLLDKEEIQDDDLTLLYKEKEQHELNLNEIEKQYYALKGELDLREKEQKDLQRKKELSDALLMELSNKSNEAKLSFAAQKERLSVEFGIELAEDEITLPQPPPNEAELKTRIDQLKAAIERLGQVNPMAMEAYKEIKERYDLIIAQKNDILSAKNSLLQTISEIDTTARESFMRTFDRVRENFIHVFRSLFTEDDSCDLILEDPQDPLETGIDIVAKPKGKRPQTINQLSGGEKTLTAVALLFSIYLIKPAPFCIFDEVDAPLDDANIDKFNNIIKKFSHDSQFIIVTHNKRTMAATDVIYGVTMIETGISKVVPVDLRSLN